MNNILEREKTYRMHMDRYNFLKTVSLSLLLAVAVGCLSTDTTSSRKPNIILIMADDLGYECLGCYGSKDYETPNIDNLATTGIRFDHCYSQPVCTPSRVQIMTGRYNHRNYEGFGYLNPRETTFANLVKEAGYATCIAGKWQLCGDATTVRNFGFDEHCLWNMHAYQKEPPDAKEPKTWLNRYRSPTIYKNGKWMEYGVDAYGPDVICDFICSFLERHKSDPFLVYYPMILPHDPFLPTPDSTDQKQRDVKKNFRDMVQYIDKIVGRIVFRLDELGLRDNTLILFTSDNGTHSSITSDTAKGKVRGGKSKMTDAGTHVPLIAHWLGKTPLGVVCDDLIDFSDFLPTLVELSGGSLPKRRVIDGRSFLPQLYGKKGSPREWVFCHYWGSKGRAWGGRREFVRDKRWKLYNDGRMYDLKIDILEKFPLKDLNDEAMAAKNRLQKAFKKIL